MHNKFYLNLNNLKSTQKFLENFLKGFSCKRKFKGTKGLNKIYLNFENSKLYFVNFEKAVKIGCYKKIVGIYGSSPFHETSKAYL